MRRAGLALVLAIAGVIVTTGQSSVDATLQAQLKRLFPAATTFSAKVDNPPHYKVYVNDARGGAPILAGFAFWTTDIVPLERGYDGPIKMIVGMDTNGILAGLIVTEQHEPYGSFSVAPPEFAAQFKGKSIRDAFQVGADIDAVSRATISVTSASRAVRNSARMIARALLTPDAVK